LSGSSDSDASVGVQTFDRAGVDRCGDAVDYSAAWHRTERYATTASRPTTGQLKRRLRPMRGLITNVGARIVIAGHAFVQNLRRGHYEPASNQPLQLRVAVAFDQLAMAI